VGALLPAVLRLQVSIGRFNCADFVKKFYFCVLVAGLTLPSYIYACLVATAWWKQRSMDKISGTSSTTAATSALDHNYNYYLKSINSKNNSK